MADILDKRPVDAEMTIFKTEVEPNKLNACIDSILMRLDRLETSMAQPVKQWVKLHDKHPDTKDFYLVCDQYGECEVAEYIPDIKSWFVHKINGEIRYWMSLPELPKED